RPILRSMPYHQPHARPRAPTAFPPLPPNCPFGVPIHRRSELVATMGSIVGDPGEMGNPGKVAGQRGEWVATEFSRPEMPVLESKQGARRAAINEPRGASVKMRPAGAWVWDTASDSLLPIGGIKVPHGFAVTLSGIDSPGQRDRESHTPPRICDSVSTESTPYQKFVSGKSTGALYGSSTRRYRSDCMRFLGSTSRLCSKNFSTDSLSKARRRAPGPRTRSLAK
ncbi:MAG: hypothetical protein ACI9X4_002807, partial [Glaciecola sp.]